MRSLRRTVIATGLLLLLAVAPAHAAELPSHAFLFTLEGDPKALIPPPEGELEDACGVALDSSGDIYVSDYYHHTIDVFDSSHTHLITQIADPGGPCDLAVDSSGDIYVDNWREDVVSFTPSEFPPTESTIYGPATVIDPGRADGGLGTTGLALDPATGSLYVDERTQVAVYEAPIVPEVPSLQIGLDEGASYYGLAVSNFPASVGDVYVADAATDTVKVFHPATSLTVPVQVIDGGGTPQRGFRSLLDTDLAVDRGNGHLYVADNTEPGFEVPAAVVDEFNARGAYRGQLPHAIVDAEPTALALDASGNVFATSGNTEGAVLYAFGPTVPGHVLEVARSGAGEGTVSSRPAGIDCGRACDAEYNVGAELLLTAVAAPGSVFSSWSGCPNAVGAQCTVTMAADEAVGAEFEPAPEPPLAAARPTALSAAESSSADVGAGRPVPVHLPARRHRPHRHHHKGRALRARGAGR